jgi:type II secretory pathway component GspD/PulD (secretin)
MLSAVLLSAAVPALAQEQSVSDEEAIRQVEEQLAKDPTMTEAQRRELKQQLDELRTKQGKQPANQPTAVQPTAPTAQPASPTVVQPGQTPAQAAAERRKKLMDQQKEKAEQQRGNIKPTTTAPPPVRPITAPGTPGAAARPAGADMPKGPTSPITTELNEEDLAQYELPSEQRHFRFGFKDLEFADIIAMFGRMFGTPVTGDAPQGKTSFTSNEPLDFKTALRRLRILLLQHSPDPRNPYWILYEDGQLSVLTINDLKRVLPYRYIFPTLKAYLDAHLDESDVAMVVYTPERGSVVDLEPVRDFMPDYFRVAPYSDKNAVTIYGPVFDINKYLDLVKLFEGAGDDPRKLERIPIVNMLPSKAVEALSKLMDLPAQTPGVPAAARMPKAGRPADSPFVNVVAQTVDYYADDEQQVLIVKAMQDQLDKIHELLKIIDVSAAEGAAPTIIPMRYARVEEVAAQVNQLLAQPGAAKAPVRTPRAGKPGTPTPMPAVPGGAGAIVVPEPRQNRAIVFGDDAMVALVRTYIDMFDVPKDAGPRHVTLNFLNPDLIASQLQNMITSERAQMPNMAAIQGFTAVGDGMGGLLINGTPQDMERAEALIKQLDVADEDPPKIHAVKLANAKPSTLVPLLMSWATSGGAAGAAAPPPPPAPGGKSPGAARRNRTPQQMNPGGIFTADDANSIIYVVASNADFEQRYAPLIKELDASADGGHHVIPILHAAPQEVLTQLQTMLALGGQAPPAMVATASAIIVRGLSEADLARVRAIVADLDIDPTGLVESRHFTLKHADPNEMKTLLETLMSTSGVAVTFTGRPGAPAPVAAASAPGVVMIPLPDGLYIKAPKARMPEIAKLVDEFDVASTIETEMRVYPFPPGTNVAEMATALQTMYAGGAMTRPPGPGRRNRGGPPQPTPTPTSGGSDDVRIIPIVADRKIAIVAPLAMFTDIEASIQKLTPDSRLQSLEIRFFPLVHTDPAGLQARLEPLLKAKLSELSAGGQISLPDGPARAQVEATLLTIIPDDASNRLIVSAPKALIDQADLLIAELDRADPNERVVKSVKLERSDPKQMVEAIQGIFISQQGVGGPAKLRRPPGAKPEAAPLVSGPEVSILAAPGGGAVVLAGLASDVGRAEQYVKQLDENASSGKMLKVYTFPEAGVDVDKLADNIMSIVDGGGPESKPAAKKESGGFLEDVFTSFTLGGPRKGKDIFLNVDYYNKTILAAASPAKMREIDEVISLYQREDVRLATRQGPSPLFYELKHRDAYDAKWDLRDLLDQLWQGDDKPVVDKLTLGDNNVLVIKAKPDRYDEIKELIAKWIDKPDKSKSDIVFRHRSVDKYPASEVARMLTAKLSGVSYTVEEAGSGTSSPASSYIERVVPGPEPKKEEDEGATRGEEPPTTGEPTERREFQINRKLNPCVLPACLSADLVTALALGQTQETSEEATEKERIRDSAVQSNAQPKGTESPPATEAASKPAGTAPDAKKPTTVEQNVPPEEPLKIRIDPVRNSISLEGPRDLVRAATDVMDEILKDIEKLHTGPDIRVFRMRYVDVNVAAQILESMFGTGQSMRGMNPQMMAQLNAANAAAAAAAAARGGAGKGAVPGAVPNVPGMPNIPGVTGPGGGAEKGGRGGGRREGGGDGEREGETAAAPTPEVANIRVFPDTRTQTIIVRAATEDFPAVIELLATVDKPGREAANFRVYELKKLNAGEMEQTLRGLLGLDARAGGQRRSINIPRGGDPAQIAQQIQNQMMQFAVEGGATGTLGPNEQVTITSNGATNTVMAMGPKSVLDLIQKLIDKMDNRETPGEPEWLTFALEHADASEMVSQLSEMFDASGGSRRGRRGAGPAPGGAQPGESGINPLDVNSPQFFATHTNMLIVKALPIDIPRIKPVIAWLDVAMPPGTTGQIIAVSSGDATSIATALNSFYGSGAAGGAAKPAGASSSVKIVAESGSNVLLVTAPPTLMTEIKDKITQMDKQGVADITPRTIQLTKGNASQIAQKLETAFGAAGRKNKNAIKITGDDNSRLLFVSAPEDVFPKIEELAGKLDIASAMDIRIYPLRYARAPDVLNKLKEMVTQLFAMAGKKGGLDMEVFSAVADERSNALVVVGGPQTFEMIEKIKDRIDVLPAAPIARVTKIFALVTSKSDEVANNINAVFSKPQDGIEPPKAVANVSTNALILEGTQAQVERIEAEVINKLEEFYQKDQDFQTDVIALQYAQPDTVAETLKKLFENRAAAMRDAKKVGIKPSEMTVAITPDVDAKQIIVMATKPNLDLIHDRIKDMDKPETAIGSARSTRAYKLTYADPNSLATVFNQMTPPGAKVAERDRINASPEWATQSVVVTASEDKHKEIKRLIDELDKSADATASPPRLIALQHARASQIEQSLTRLFGEQPGRGGRGGFRNMFTTPPVIVPNEATNTLLVKAAEDDFERIKETVALLDIDTGGVPTQLKIIPVPEGVNVTDMAHALEESFRRGEDAQRQADPSYRPQLVSIVPDVRSNSLIVSGASSRFADVEQTVEILAKMKPSGRQVIRVLQPAHIDAEDVKRIIQQLHEQQASPSGGRRGR